MRKKEYVEIDFNNPSKASEKPETTSEAAKLKELTSKTHKLTLLVLILGVLLLAACVGLVICLVKLGKKPAERVVYKDGEKLTVDDTDKNAVMIENLEEVISASKVNDATFEATEVENYQYLVANVEVSAGKTAKIYYRNEFATEKKGGVYILAKDGLSSAYIEYGDKKLPIAKEISTELSSLVPMVVNVAEEKAGLLFYVMDEETSTPTDMCLYNINTMEDMGSINFKETLYYYFTCKNSGEGASDKVLTVGADASELYTYRVSDEAMNKFNTDGKHALDFFKKYECEFNEAGVNFKSYVSITDKEYLGEYTMVVDYQSNGINLAKVNFDAYVDFSYEDVGNDRIITPRESYIENGLRTWGDKGGHYIVPLYENFAKDDYTTEGNYEINKDDTHWTYTDPTSGKKTVLGIDVSAFQENIDWSKVAEDGIEFVIIRAGYRGYSKGLIVEDEYLENNLAGALNNGLKVGVYIFSQAINDEEAIEEAEFLIRKVSKYPAFDGPIVFDTEQYDEPKDARANLISRETRTSLTKAFCKTIETAGYLPVVYANSKWMMFGIDLDELSDYPTWYAYYGNNPTMPYHFDIWQYSCEGKVSGIRGNVDMNMMFEDVFGRSSRENSGG